MLFERDIKISISQWLDSREVLIIYGARQVGKSTLLHQLFNKWDDALILNCELPVVSDTLSSRDPVRMKSLFENHKYIALDEAQTIHNIGSVLKIVYDELPKYKIVATGSSSFEIANKIIEPLTGRNIKFRLFALSLSELKRGYNWLWVLQNLGNLLVYGSYPGLINLQEPKRQLKLAEITTDYLFRDVLIYESIKNPLLIRQLLKALALQIGQLVSTNELSNLLGVARPTIEKYLDLLEKSFVIFNLPAFSGNLRNEIRKSKKYYFYDLGIRNALIGNYAPVENRTDIGGLWENFCVAERLKWLSVNQPLANCYFWRTYDGAELDLIEEFNGKLTVFEFKWNPKRKASLPKSFSEKYEVSSFSVISSSNFSRLIESSSKSPLNFY